MAVDIGYIVKYDSIKQSGLLEGKISTLLIPFTLRQVKDNNISRRLAIGNCRGLRVWYTYEAGSATSLSSRPDDLPDEDHVSLEKLLKKCWATLDNPKPDWLDGVTKQLGGPKLLCEFSAMREELEHQRRKKEETPMEKQQVHIDWEKVKSSSLTHLFDNKAKTAEKNVIQPSIAQPKKVLPQGAQRLQSFSRQPFEDRGTRAREIEMYCRGRGITRLMHFTRLNNLESILVNGLLSQEELRNISQEKDPVFNDHLRLDDYRNANCLTITFPNYQMFYRLQVNPENKNVHWVVLAFHADILWELDCAFNQTNAANSVIREIPLDQRKRPAALSNMFLDTPTNKRLDLHIPDNFTTDPQAEVLVFSPISVKYIQEIFVSCSALKQQALRMNVPNELQNKIIVAPDYFTPRCDYHNWQKRQSQDSFEEMLEPTPPECFEDSIPF